MTSEHELFISMRENMLGKSWVNDLWVRVIFKAIDDLALFKRMHQDGEHISEEQMFHADTAYNFLFIPGYTISVGLTLRELLGIWGYEDIERWREGFRHIIDQLIIEKRLAKKKRKKQKCRMRVQMLKIE